MEKDLLWMFLDWIFKFEYDYDEDRLLYHNLRSGLIFLLSQCSCIKTRRVSSKETFNEDLIELYFIRLEDDNIENLDIVQNSIVKSKRERTLGDNRDTYWGKLESYYKSLPHSDVAHLTRATQDLDTVEVDDPDEIFDWFVICDFNPLIPELTRSIIKRNQYEVEKFLMDKL